GAGTSQTADDAVLAATYRPADHVDVVDRPIVRVSECADDGGVAAHIDGDVGEVEIANDAVRIDEREQGGVKIGDGGVRAEPPIAIEHTGEVGIRPEAGKTARAARVEIRSQRVSLVESEIVLSNRLQVAGIIDQHVGGQLVRAAGQNMGGKVRGIL